MCSFCLTPFPQSCSQPRVPRCAWANHSGSRTAWDPSLRGLPPTTPKRIEEYIRGPLICQFARASVPRAVAQSSLRRSAATASRACCYNRHERRNLPFCQTGDCFGPNDGPSNDPGRNVKRLCSNPPSVPKLGLVGVSISLNATCHASVQLLLCLSWPFGTTRPGVATVQRAPATGWPRGRYQEAGGAERVRTP
jgi:hypothetical protein